MSGTLHPLPDEIEARLADAFSRSIMVKPPVAAMVLGIDERALRTLVNQGLLGYIRLRGNHRRYTELNLRSWLNPRYPPPPPPPKEKRKPGRVASITPEMRKVHRRIGQALRRALGSSKAGRAWSDLVGYSPRELVRHIEARFVEGMSWENIGAWHIDHIRPLSSFPIEGPDCPVLREAWALDNLQPLWATDNLRKGVSW